MSSADSHPESRRERHTHVTTGIVLVTPSLDEQTCREITEQRAWNTRGPDWVIQRQDLDSWSATELDNIVAEEVIITRERIHRSPSR